MLPGENVNSVAAEPIRSWLEPLEPLEPLATGASLPIFTFDAGDDAVQLRRALANRPVGLLSVSSRSPRAAGALGGASMTSPLVNPVRGDHGGMGRTCVCDDPTTWPIPTAPWTVADPDYGQMGLQAWSAGCTQLHKTMRPAAHASPDRSSAERSFGSKSSACHDPLSPRKRRPRSGSGGLDPRPQISLRSGAPPLLGSRLSLPCAFSSKRCTGRRRNCARQPLLTAGPGC
jgi:hypothetical protein